MQEQNRQGVRLEGRENDEVKWEELRPRINEEEDGIHRRGWFGAGFFHWSDHRPAAAGALSESLTPQHPHNPSNIHTPEVATSGTSTTTAKLEDDGTWNKRLNGYVFFLGVALSMIVIVRPLLPRGYDCWMLAGFAMVWGLGSIGIPLGMFGTTRLEKNISRHIWRFVSLCFSLLVIYATYLLAKHTDARDSFAPGSSPPSPESDVDSGVTSLDVFFVVLLLCLATFSHGPRFVTMVVIDTWSQSDKVLMDRFSFKMCIFRFSVTFMLGCLSTCKLH